MPHTIAQEEKHPSSFDAHHPPEKKYIDDCVHCGFCLPACPTYVLWGEEMDSPRGRIYMIKKAAEGEAPLDDRFRQHMDNCLGCMACMTACPSGVEYNKLIEPTRAQIERNLPRSLGESLFRKLLFATFPHPERLRLLALPLLVYQRSGLRSLLRATGMLKLLPEAPGGDGSAAARRADASVQHGCLRVVQPTDRDAPPRRHAERMRATGLLPARERSHRARAGGGRLRSVIPREQPCCGALMLHSGMEDEAVALAKKMIAAFEAADVDTIVINSAGCGSTMKEYGHLLRDDPAWAERAAAFSAKCKDISEILCELEPQAPRHPLKLRVAYHDACHLQHAQGVREQPRRLLAGIPGLEVAEIPEARSAAARPASTTCCSPRRPTNSATAKWKICSPPEPQAVLSANPGCLLQLMNGLRRRGLKAMPAFHMVELLDASIRGVSADELLARQITSRATKR